MAYIDSEPVTSVLLISSPFVSSHDIRSIFHISFVLMSLLMLLFYMIYYIVIFIENTVAPASCGAQFAISLIYFIVLVCLCSDCLLREIHYNQDLHQWVQLLQAFALVE